MKILQVAVLISGIIYMIIGITYYFSPMIILKIFVENVSENWFDLVRDHELIAPLYYTVRAFAATLFAAGVLMIMPLFDPLKYRGIVYVNGVLFPFMASLVLIKNGLFLKVKQLENSGNVQGDYSHTLVIILGSVLALIFLANLIMLFVTKADAKAGVE